MSAETVRVSGAAAAVLAEDPYRAVAQHLPDAAAVLFDRDLRVRLATGTTLPDPAWCTDHDLGRAVVWMLAHSQGVCDRAGRVVRVVGTNQDITKAKQAEQERRRLLGHLYELLGHLYELLDGQHQRLAADLHDRHMQSLATIALRLDQVAVRLDRGDIAQVGGQLRETRQQSRDELAALRRTIATLRPLVLDRRGLAAAVAELATATCDRAGLDACEVAVDLDGPPLDPVVETALFRVAQQALANVEQHANARRLRVALCRDGPDVALVVQDDGRGFDPAHTQAVADTHGFGLTCMLERLQAIGGQFTLRSAPGAGTRIQVRAAAQAPS